MSDDQLRFVVLGRSDDGTVTIAIAPARVDTRVSLSAGPHASNAGGQVGLDVVLNETRTKPSPVWQEYFDAARANWLVPFLVRLAEGRDVKESKLVKAFEKRHGYAPDIELQPRYGT